MASGAPGLPQKRNCELTATPHGPPLVAAVAERSCPGRAVPHRDAADCPDRAAGSSRGSWGRRPRHKKWSGIAMKLRSTPDPSRPARPICCGITEEVDEVRVGREPAGIDRAGDEVGVGAATVQIGAADRGSAHTHLVRPVDGRGVHGDGGWSGHARGDELVVRTRAVEVGAADGAGPAAQSRPIDELGVDGDAVHPIDARDEVVVGTGAVDLRPARCWSDCRWPNRRSCRARAAARSAGRAPRALPRREP